MEFISAYDEQLKELELRERKIQATIQDELDELENKRHQLIEEREQAIDEYFSSRDPQDLLDPLKAGPLYELGYDNGRGAPGFYDFYSTLIEGTCLSGFSGWWSLSNETSQVKMPTFVLEYSYDPQRFNSSIELLEALYRAAIVTNPSVPVDVYGLGDNYRVKLVNHSWSVYQLNTDPLLEGISTLAEAIQLIQARRL